MNDNTAPGTALAISGDMTEKQIKLVKDTICKGASDNELQLFLIICERTGLDPFARQIYMIKRGTAMVTEASIDGLRLVAERSGKYAGQLGPFWCGKDKVWHDLWIEKEHPVAAKVGILRKDFSEPLWATAIWDQYVPQSPFMWVKLPSLMIAKCAEALGLRKAFPQELSGIYAKEEMEQADVVETPKASFTHHQTTEVKDVTPETKSAPKQEKEDINAPACTELQVKNISELVALSPKPMETDKWICDKGVSSYGELTYKQADDIIQKLEKALDQAKSVGKSDKVDDGKSNKEKPKANEKNPISQKQIDLINRMAEHYHENKPGKLSLLILSVGGKSLEKLNALQASVIIEAIAAETKKDHAETKKAKDNSGEYHSEKV